MATKEITIDNIDSAITDSPILFLDFWAAWCGPCRMFEPVYEKAAQTHADVVFGKVDTEAQQELAAGFRISSIPTLMAFRENILVFSQPGALNSPQLEQVIQAVRDLDMDDVRAKIAAETAAEANQAEGSQAQAAG